jgi:hypothetical protein
MAYSLKEGLRIINRRENGWPVPFIIEWISFDSNIHRSGRKSELKRAENVVKIESSHDSKTAATISFKQLNHKGKFTARIKCIMKINGQWVQ